MPATQRVFLHACRGTESDPTPRRLQLKDTVRFRNILRTLDGEGELFWRQRRVDPDACPAEIGMRGTLEHPVKLVYVPRVPLHHPLSPRSPRAIDRTSSSPPQQQRSPDRQGHATHNVPMCETAEGGDRRSRGKAKLLSPDPRILLNRKSDGGNKRSTPPSAPSRLISPVAPITAAERSSVTNAKPVTLSYPSEAVTYTPQVLWSQPPLMARSAAAHRYGSGGGDMRVSASPVSAATPEYRTARRRNVPILEPPELIEAASAFAEPRRGPDTAALLQSLETEVRALRDELASVARGSSPRAESPRRSIRAATHHSVSASRSGSPRAAAERSPLPYFPRWRWTSGAYGPPSPSARNPYFVDEVADELHHAQLVRLAELRHLD